MGNRTEILSRIIVAICLLLLLEGAALAAPSTLRVRQTYLDYPSFTVYADLLDAAGKPFIPGGAGQLTATVGGRAFNVSRWGAFSAKNDGILIIFLIDISASIGQSRFTELQETVSGWIRRMGPSDRAAVMSFGENVSVVQGFTAEQNALLYAVQSLSPQDPGAQLNLGLLRALELAKIKSSGLPARRMILLCSDGFLETLGGATADEVRNALSSDPVPVYSIFFDSPEHESTNRNTEVQQLLNELGYDAGPVDGKLGPRTVAAIRIFQQSRGVAWDGSVSNELLGVLRTMVKKQKDAALASIGEFSRRSGGQLYRVGTSPFASIFDSVAASLGNALALHITLEGLVPDATVKRLEITFSDGTRSLSDGIEFRLLGNQAEQASSQLPGATKESSSKLAGSSAWAYLLAITAVVILPLSIWLMQRKKRNARIESANTGASGKRSLQVKDESSPTVVLSETAPAASLHVELTPSGARGTDTTLRAVIPDRIVLGRNRGPSTLSILGDATVSARHCELVFSKGKLFVNDLHSSNGTMVNGVPIQGNYPLEDGDRLQLGKTELRIRILEAK